MMQAAYTVALCTHNHASRLARTLVDLRALRQAARPWELLVIDNGCTDGAAELLAAQSWPPAWRVRVVHEPKLGLSNARNCAIREAAGEYLIFIDDDETPDPDWLRDDLLGFLGQLQRSGEIVPPTERSTTFYGGNFGFRRAVCERVGDFDAMLGLKGMGRDNCARRPGLRPRE